MENWSILRIIMVAIFILICIFTAVWFYTMDGFAPITMAIMNPY